MTVPCIILAGGLGTRLRGVVPDLPKCLAPIDGRPFLEWQLRSLSERGVAHFVLALGFGAEKILKSLTNKWANGLIIDTVIERELLGTGGAAQFAMEETGLTDALIANGDTFLGGSIDPMLAPLEVSNGEIMRIATVKVPDRSRFGGVCVDNSQHVTSFLEKGQRGAGQINAGLYRVHRQAFEGEPAGAFSIETRIMPKLIERHALKSCQINGPFIDIGVPEDYLLFNANVYDYVRKV